MALVEAPRSTKSVIYWAVVRSIDTSAEADTYAASAVPIEAKTGKVLARGTVTLGNGGKRKAERFYASFTGRIFIRYQAPNGGRWHLALTDAVEASFTAE